MHMKRTFFLFSLLLVYSFPALAEVKVATSILPLHSLASMVTEGVSEPKYIIGSGVSPHSYALKPSDIKKISAADIIFMIDKDFESFLSKALNDKEEKTVFLSQAPDIKLLPLRRSDDWSRTVSDRYDLHLWLDTDNAAAIVRHMAQILSAKDPKNAGTYQKNADKAVRKLSDLGKNLQEQLLPYQNEPFLVFHDGWQYFTAQNGLNAKGAILLDEDIPLSVKQRLNLAKLIRTENIGCIFSEPQFSDKTALLLADKNQIRTTKADPLGAGIIPGTDLYFQVLINAGQAMQRCLHRHQEP